MGHKTNQRVLQDPVKARVDFEKTGQEIHDFIRGNDRVPGAWAVINGQVRPIFEARTHQRLTLLKAFLFNLGSLSKFVGELLLKAYLCKHR